MAKKKRKGAVRAKKRAAPRPQAKRTIDPNDPVVASAGQEIGRVLGRGLGDMVKKFGQAAKDSPGLNRQAEIAKGIIPDEKTLDVRVPDAQHVTWQKLPDDPSRQQGWYEDPLSTMEPVSAEWTWYPFENGGSKVVVNKSFGPNGAYIVTLSIDVAVPAVEFLRGSGANAKKVAEALLSASDWEHAWRAVMGPDTTQDVWRNYERKK